MENGRSKNMEYTGTGHTGEKVWLFEVLYCHIVVHLRAASFTEIGRSSDQRKEQCLPFGDVII